MVGIWRIHIIAISPVNISPFKTTHETWDEIYNSNKKCQFGVVW